MKSTRAALLGLLLTTILSSGCESFLDKEPLGTTTQDNLFKDPTNAVQAINAVYDVAAWDQGPTMGRPQRPVRGPDLRMDVWRLDDR